MPISTPSRVPYTPGPDPILEESKAIYLQRELRRIADAVRGLNEALAEVIGEANIIFASDAAAIAALNARNISTGTGLTGGGNLSADRTIALNAASIASLALADNSAQKTGGNTISGTQTLTGLVDLSSSAPELRLSETDQTDPTGRWRFAGVSGDFKLQRSTASGWSTSADVVTYSSSGAATFAGAVTVTGALAASDTLTVTNMASFNKLTTAAAQFYTDPSDTGRYVQFINDNFSSLGVQLRARFGGSGGTVGKFVFSQGDSNYIFIQPSANTIGSNNRIVFGAAIEAGDYYVGADTSGTAAASLVSAKSGSNYTIRSGNSASNSMVLFQDSGGGTIGRLDDANGTSGNTNTIITRQKGDARYQAISARRYKDDIQPRNWVDLTTLDLKKWTWGGDLDVHHQKYNRPGSGFIAEEVLEVLPEAVTYDADGKIQGLDALTLVAHLTKHVAALEARIAALENS